MEQNLNEPNPFDDSNYKKGEKFMKLSDSIAGYIEVNGYYGLHKSECDFDIREKDFCILDRAIELISLLCPSDLWSAIDKLTGHLWDKEEADDIKRVFKTYISEQTGLMYGVD